MSAPLNNDPCKVAIFDSFSKTVLRNISRNITKAKERQQGKEMIGTEKMQYLFEGESVEDTYPSEHIITGMNGDICVITKEWLYQALLQLPEQQREVLILEYWYGVTRHEIAEIMHVSSRSIYTWKQKAIRFIRDYYERNI